MWGAGPLPASAGALEIRLIFPLVPLAGPRAQSRFDAEGWGVIAALPSAERQTDGSAIDAR
jgi:hypothetical protein